MTCNFLFLCFYSLSFLPWFHLKSLIQLFITLVFASLLSCFFFFFSLGPPPMPLHPRMELVEGVSGGQSQWASEAPSQCSFDLFHIVSFHGRCCLTKNSTAQRKSLQSFCINSAEVLTGFELIDLVEMKGISGEPGPVALSRRALAVQRRGGSEAGRTGMATTGEAEGPRIWVQYRN